MSENFCDSLASVLFHIKLMRPVWLWIKFFETTTNGTSYYIWLNWYSCVINWVITTPPPQANNNPPHSPPPEIRSQANNIGSINHLIQILFQDVASNWNRSKIKGEKISLHSKFWNENQQIFSEGKF